MNYDWLSLQEKTKTEDTMDWNSFKEKAKAFATEAADGVMEIANDISTKVNEAWNSEESIKVREDMKEYSTQAQEWLVDKKEDVSEWAQEQGQSLTLFTKKVSTEVGELTSEMWNNEGFTKFRGKSAKALKIISGMQAVEDRRKSLQTREEADLLKADIERTNEDIREDLNEVLEDLGRFRLEALSATVGKFLRCLEMMNQKAKGKEYEFLTQIDITSEQVKEMEAVDMKASDALRTLAVGGGFAAIGVAGTPAIVTSAVTAMCAAGTGTAISSLSGAAATNAVLAWLGGGTIAAKGGGIAAGTIVLGAITASATIGLAVAAVGTLASRFYAKKNTEAEAYLAEVKVWAEQVQASWTVLAGVKRRVLELHDLTEQLLERSAEKLTQLEEVAPVFAPSNETHVKLFQQCAILAKSMSELAQTPILDNDGNLSEESVTIAGKTQKILNSEL